MVDRHHAVVISGAGPTGLMLAGELSLAGIDVVVVERRLTDEVDGSRAGGLHARTLEVLDQRGIVERFVSKGTAHHQPRWSDVALDITDFPTRFNYTLALWQSDFEPLLAGWVAERGVPVLRGLEVTGFVQNDDGVDVAISDGSTIRAAYLVGCDGGRSVVRKAAGIEFVGLPASTSWMIAEVEFDGSPSFGLRKDATGTHAMGPTRPGGPVRVVITEKTAEHTTAPSFDELTAAVVDVWGEDFGLRRANWISRFSDMTRQAAQYRNGRVLVAGDAAHVHPPQGGQGLNTGVQDAVNLGWKLAQVVRGTSSPTLLDSYHAERHPVAARVLHNTQAAVALSKGDERHQSLRDILNELLVMDAPRKRIAGMLTALDIHYDLGGSHPLVGRRMPDLDVTTSSGPRRVFSFLHAGKPVLLRFNGAVSDVDLRPWAETVPVADVDYEGLWELPVLGAVAAPGAVLVRPDGHVAWVGTMSAGLMEALTTWFEPTELMRSTSRLGCPREFVLLAHSTAMRRAVHIPSHLLAKIF